MTSHTIYLIKPDGTQMCFFSFIKRVNIVLNDLKYTAKHLLIQFTFKDGTQVTAPVGLVDNRLLQTQYESQRKLLRVDFYQGVVTGDKLLVNELV